MTGGRLYWRFVEDSLDEVIQYLQKVFRYHEKFHNIGGTGIINLGVDNRGIAFEHWFYENEQYPVIVIAGQGGNLQNTGIGDLWDEERFQQTVGNPLLTTGYRTLGTEDSLEAATSFVAQEQVNLRTISAYLASQGPAAGGITVRLHEGDPNGPTTQVASGSLGGFLGSSYVNKSVELYPVVQLEKGSMYWLSLEADTTDSEYRVGEASSSGQLTAYRSGSSADWVISQSGSLGVKVQGAPNTVVGGRGVFSLAMSVLAKEPHDSRRLAELSAIFLILSRRGAFNRSIAEAENIKMNWGALADFAKKGIYIEDVGLGAEQVTIRGDQQVYENTVTATVSGEWAAAFEEEFVERIDVNDSTY